VTGSRSVLRAFQGSAQEGFKFLRHHKKVKVKISLFQAVEAHRVARG
jgi:hypothetical protein